MKVRGEEREISLFDCFLYINSPSSGKLHIQLVSYVTLLPYHQSFGLTFSALMICSVCSWS